MNIRDQIITAFKAEHGREPSGSMVRILERHRVEELNPSSAEAVRIRGDIAERESVQSEALSRWFSTRSTGIPARMPKVATLIREVQAERRQLVTI
ncbi:hypothetical protein DC31_08020 [Microbacterium sp. CH12i]|uniref:hypothetical protein n=1 Tax=Microbacterium sp. CH12i TaxID=1479651 RepID=UPI00046146F4|nr:hypothetical protein [Microbacterium sp. CH12i]KDA04515.1 hypothetical protein DC31_08020 [Microbacterium sp. CH12i]